MPKIACKHCKMRKAEEEYAITADDKLDIYCIACRLKEMDGEVLGVRVVKKVVKPKPKRIKMTEAERKAKAYLQGKAWRDKNREKVRAYHRKYYRENKGKYIESMYRNRPAKASKRDLSKRNASKRLQRFNNPIRYCRSCLTYKKQEEFSLTDPQTWSLVCDKCIETISRVDKEIGE